jgi:hypothetical protein
MNGGTKKGLDYKRPRRLKCDRWGYRRPHKYKKKEEEEEEEEEERRRRRRRRRRISDVAG